MTLLPYLVVSEDFSGDNDSFATLAEAQLYALELEETYRNCARSEGEWTELDRVSIYRLVERSEVREDVDGNWDFEKTYPAED